MGGWTEIPCNVPIPGIRAWQRGSIRAPSFPRITVLGTSAFPTHIAIQSGMRFGRPVTTLCPMKRTW